MIWRYVIRHTIMPVRVCSLFTLKSLQLTKIRFLIVFDRFAGTTVRKCKKCWSFFFYFTVAVIAGPSSFWVKTPNPNLSGSRKLCGSRTKITENTLVNFSNLFTGVNAGVFSVILAPLCSSAVFGFMVYSHIIALQLLCPEWDILLMEMNINHEQLIG